MSALATAALARTASWPVPTVAAAAILPDGSIQTVGEVDRSFALASLSKMFVGWTALIASEEGTLDLDQSVGQDGCTVRHLLAHAGGYAFDGPAPIARPAVRRIYSNTGIEMAADAITTSTGIEFAQYLQEAVLDPLGMSATTLTGSPAYGMHSTVTDLLRFMREVRSSTLLSIEGMHQFRTVQFPGLPAWCLASGASLIVRGDSAPKCEATSHRTGLAR